MSHTVRSRFEFNRTAKDLKHYGELRMIELARSYVSEFNKRHLEKAQTLGKLYSDLLIFLKEETEDFIIELILMEGVILCMRKSTNDVIFTITYDGLVKK